MWISLKQFKPEDKIVQVLSQGLDESLIVGQIEAFRKLIFKSQLVDFSHWQDTTGRKESNVWKLITELRVSERSPGFNLVSLFRKFERALNFIDDEPDAVASKEPNKINLMTIHKSKGLKFKYVILPHMDKVVRASSSKGHTLPIVENEDMNKWSPLIPVGEKNEMKHSSGALLALDELSQREAEESLRLFYVAITRAEEALCFHGLEQPKKDSWADELQFWNYKDGKHQFDKYTVSVTSSVYEEIKYIRSEDSLASGVRSKFETNVHASSVKAFFSH